MGLYALGVYCCQPLLQFEMQLIPPDVLRPHLERFDLALVALASAATRVNFLALDEITRRRLRLPKGYYGGALRSMADVAPAAYVGGLLQSIPAFVDQVDAAGNVVRAGIANHLAHVYSRIETKNIGGRDVDVAVSFADGDGTKRFEAMIASGCKFGRDLARYWGELRDEVTVRGIVRGSGPLTAEAEGAGFIEDPTGGGHVVAKPQHAITVQREKLRFDVLGEDIDRLDAKDQRRRVWHDMDKLSTQFVGATPSRNNRIPNTKFWQASSDYYGVPSLVFSRLHREGRKVGKQRRGPGQGAPKTVDPYGDNVASAQGLKGDTWRDQHDEMKWTLYDLWRQFCGSVRAEVEGLFAYLLDQRDAFERLSKRQRAGMVPDLAFKDAGYTGNVVLADVKTLHRGSSTYRVGDTRKEMRAEAVARRGRAVHGDYVRHARRLDRDFGPADEPLAEGETGPVEAKLNEFPKVWGLVFGALGEGSPDVEKFIYALGEMGAARSWRKMGARNVREAAGLIRGMARETIGIAAVRSAARCKLERLAVIDGSDEGAAARRRRDRFSYEEQRRYRRNFDGHRRARRFDGPRAHRRDGE